MYNIHKQNDNGARYVPSKITSMQLHTNTLYVALKKKQQQK